MTDRLNVLQFRDLTPADPLGDTTPVTTPAEGVGRSLGSGGLAQSPNGVVVQAAENIGLAAQHVINAADDVMRAAEHAAQRPTIDPRGINQDPAKQRAKGLLGDGLSLRETRIRIDPTLRTEQGSVGARCELKPVTQESGQQTASELAGAEEKFLRDPEKPRRETFSLPEPRPERSEGSGLGLLAVLFPVLTFAAFATVLLLGSGKPSEGWKPGAHLQTVAAPSLPEPEPASRPAKKTLPEPHAVSSRGIGGLALAPAEPIDTTSPSAVIGPASVANCPAPAASTIARAPNADGLAGGSVPSNTASSGMAACIASRSPKLQLSPDKIAHLLTSGRNYMAAGHLAEARSVFRRAAEACDAYAAFALGATYDPTLLQKLGVRAQASLAPDLANARTWYEKAKKLGSAEASDQLELLATLENVAPVAKPLANAPDAVATPTGTASLAPSSSVLHRHQHKAAHSEMGLIPWLDLFGRF
jgi:TPR repeat protein